MNRGKKTGRRAYTLVEMTVVLTIMGVLTTLALPRFSRSLESARADVAGANLRAIWTAERIYWLDNRTYTANLDLLVSLNLLDPSITSNTFYSYLVTAADAATFTATAQRAGDVSWFGTLAITQDGVLTGSLTKSGEADIVVGFQ
jgi:prepilin-type N-terminal cleavage/methylation domain-containing protein